MISLSHVTKVFDTDLFKKKFVALDDISFGISSEKIVGYLGANGAGKTTSIKVMMDFIRPTQGRVEYDSVLGQTRQEALSKIGYLPERPYFYPHLTGREFAHYLGALSQLSKSAVEDALSYWAPLFKIDFALNRYLKNYSKGMLQRIGMVVSLLHRPRLLVLDEPLSGLDPIGRKEIKDILCMIHQKEQMTIFFSSHIVSDVEEICHETIFIKDGKIAYQGSVDHLLTQHTKSQIKISYYQNDRLNYLSVNSSKDLHKQLQELISAGASIYEVSTGRPTLEEIIYEI